MPICFAPLFRADGRPAGFSFFENSWGCIRVIYFVACSSGATSQSHLSMPREILLNRSAVSASFDSLAGLMGNWIYRLQT